MTTTAKPSICSPTQRWNYIPRRESSSHWNTWARVNRVHGSRKGSCWSGLLGGCELVDPGWWFDHELGEDVALSLGDLVPLGADSVLTHAAS
jgi:hypothetical protein